MDRRRETFELDESVEPLLGEVEPEAVTAKPSSSMYILGLVTSLTIGVAAYSLTFLEPEDKISIGHGVGLFVLGCVFFTTFFVFCVHVIQRTGAGQFVIKKYRLNNADILDISNKIVSSVQALLSSYTGLTICTYSCYKNFLRATHHISHAYAWFGAAYFLYDIWSMYKVHVNTPPGQINTPSTHMHTPVPPPESGTGAGAFLRYIRLNPIIIGHHLFIGLFGFSVIIYFRGNLGDCVFGFVFLMEASTPFVSFRSILSRFQLKSSKLYVYNGFAMLLVFFLCRIVMFPYVMYLYAKAANMSYIGAINSLPVGCKVSISILLFPQLYWSYLMVKGATKILCGTPKMPSSSGEHQRIPTS